MPVGVLWCRAHLSSLVQTLVIYVGIGEDKWGMLKGMVSGSPSLFWVVHIIILGHPCCYCRPWSSCYCFVFLPVSLFLLLFLIFFNFLLALCGSHIMMHPDPRQSPCLCICPMPLPPPRLKQNTQQKLQCVPVCPSIPFCPRYLRMFTAVSHSSGSRLLLHRQC